MRNFILLILIVFYSGLNSQTKLKDSGAYFAYEFSPNKIGNQEQYNSQLRLTPASLTKIVTTATALQLLGPDFTYKTNISYSGTIQDGELTGNLIINSDGDPTLGSSFFSDTKPELLLNKIAEVIQSKGIKRIQGKIIINADTVSYAAPRLWEDMGNYYGASPHGFNYMDNTINVYLKSGQAGTKCKVASTYPEFDPFQLDCRVLAANHKKDSAYVFGVGSMQEWWIEGSIPENRNTFKIKAAMPNPQLVFVNHLTKQLKEQGIEVHNQDIERESEIHLIYNHYSPSLAEIIKVINHKSNNLFADQLWLTMAMTMKGKADWDLGRCVFEEYWKDRIDYQSHFKLKDGSGLSPKNLISPKGMVQLLNWMEQKSPYFPFFKNSLAEGGKSGTLRSVFKHPQLKGKIYGKSGSMESVLGYCGYLTTSNGNSYAFCMIANHYIVSTKIVRDEMNDFITKFVLQN